MSLFPAEKLKATAADQYPWSRVGPTHGAQLGLAKLAIVELRSVDDFLAFDTARRFAMTREIPPEIASIFELEFAPDKPPHDSEWLRCSNFIVRRAGERRRSPAHA